MRVVEVQISATEWKDQNFKEGEILLLSPRKAKVFLAMYDTVKDFDQNGDPDFREVGEKNG